MTSQPTPPSMTTGSAFAAGGTRTPLHPIIDPKGGIAIDSIY
jgi:hypothetical protein